MNLSNVFNSTLNVTLQQIGKVTAASWQVQVPLIITAAAVILGGMHVCTSKRAIKKPPALFDILKGLGDAPHLLAYLQELTKKSAVQNQKLQQRIQPSNEVDNLLVIEELLRPHGEAVLALKDLDRLMSQALQKQLKSMPRVGKELLEKTQALVGKEFPLPLAGKLALVASLHEPGFQNNYKATLESFQKDAAPQAWSTHMTPLVRDEKAPQKYVSVRLLENLLMAKAGMGEPLVFAENLPAIAMSLDQLREDHRLGRPVHARDIALKHLQRYSTEEQRMLQREGYSPNVQLGCLDFFTCQGKISNCQFTFGYALPSLGTITAQLELNLQGFEEQDPKAVMLFMKACLDTNLQGIDKVIDKNQDWLNGLGEVKKSKLIENSRRLKQESDRLLQAAYMALGNPSNPLPKELKFTSA